MTRASGGGVTEHRIAVIAGDGIGREVVPEGIRVLDAAGAKQGLRFRWDELPTIHPDDLTIDNVPGRLAKDGDPWAGMDDAPQSIEPLVERYRADLARGIPDAPWPPVYPKMPDEAPRVNPSRARHED